MPSDHERDYEVGYGKPPRHSRFKTGQSGNPRGRAPGAKNLRTLLSEALNECVIVTENGGRRKVTKREAIIKQLVNQSATADWRAIKILLDLIREIEGQSEPTSPETSVSNSAEAEPGISAQSGPTPAVEERSSPESMEGTRARRAVPSQATERRAWGGAVDPRGRSAMGSDRGVRCGF